MNPPTAQINELNVFDDAKLAGARLLGMLLMDNNAIGVCRREHPDLVEPRMPETYNPIFKSHNREDRIAAIAQHTARFQDVMASTFRDWSPLVVNQLSPVSLFVNTKVSPILRHHH